MITQRLESANLHSVEYWIARATKDGDTIFVSHLSNAIRLYNERTREIFELPIKSNETKEDLEQVPK